MPTETVYGLAGSIESRAAIAAIFSLKKRPPQNPLIVHVAEASEILRFSKTFPPFFKELADAFWPGPLTLVIPVEPASILPEIRAELFTQAFRIPAHPLARELLFRVGPLIAPSANLSGRPSAVSRAHVESDFGSDFPVLDGGECQKGVESTILIWSEEKWRLGRLGAIAAEAFISLLGYEPTFSQPQAKGPLCPGQLFRHYAPDANLHLVTSFEELSYPCIVGFSDRMYPAHSHFISLGSSLAVEEVLRRLYSALRELDEKNIEEAWIDYRVPKKGLWLTFLERLQKAREKR